MSTHAYYNEIDDYAAEWLENLIRAGHIAPARVGRLRAYGNAIVAPLAAEWIRVVMECQP